jgi:hypothetical protein
MASPGFRRHDREVEGPVGASSLRPEITLYYGGLASPEQEQFSTILGIANYGRS